jgi:hypothetical protein
MHSVADRGSPAESWVAQQGGSRCCSAPASMQIDCTRLSLATASTTAGVEGCDCALLPRLGNSVLAFSGAPMISRHHDHAHTLLVQVLLLQTAALHHCGPAFAMVHYLASSMPAMPSFKKISGAAKAACKAVAALPQRRGRSSAQTCQCQASSMVHAAPAAVSGCNAVPGGDPTISHVAAKSDACCGLLSSSAHAGANFELGLHWHDRMKWHPGAD